MEGNEGGSGGGRGPGEGGGVSGPCSGASGGVGGLRGGQRDVRESDCERVTAPFMWICSGGLPNAMLGSLGERQTMNSKGNARATI